MSSNYQWGFLYLMLLVVCVLHFLFAVIMYALWIEANTYDVAAYAALANMPRYGANADIFDACDPIRVAAARPSTLTSAIAIVSEAERHYGAEVGGWTSHKLDKRVWRGNKGMQIRIEGEDVLL